MTFAEIIDVIEDVPVLMRMKREHLALFYADLAEIVGISKTVLCNIETGMTQPSMASLVKILRWLDTV